MTLFDVLIVFFVNKNNKLWKVQAKKIDSVAN